MSHCKYVGPNGGLCKSKGVVNGTLCKTHYKLLNGCKAPLEEIVVEEKKSSKKILEHNCCIENCILTTSVMTDGKYLCYRHRS
jgi:NADH:ubiquinone oxidoreductase subunit E